MTRSVDPNYFAFMLRVWREEAQERWRASLEDPQNGERRVFADLETLFDFLRTHAYPGPEAEQQGSADDTGST